MLAAHGVPITVERLTRTYGKRRGIQDVDFQVNGGEIFGFLGPNGAGKTTTIRVLMGLLRPTAGAARIFGRDCWSDAPAVKDLVGFLPGDMHLYEKMSGHEFLDFFAGFRSKRHPRRRRMLVERFELDLSRTVRQLSKGNRQKLGIVQALMHDAPLLIMDEPSSGLDPLMQVELLDLLREEQSAGKTIFLSSHALPEVERVADRVGIIREGRLVTVEDVNTLKAARERRMEVTLHAPVTEDAFAALPDVRVLQRNDGGRQLELAVRGDLRPLLRRLSDLPVEDMTYGPPDLESVFLHYYGDDAERSAVRDAEEVRR
jgi:ABC-2 type transport system ATP-binding protein